MCVSCSLGWAAFLCSYVDLSTDQLKTAKKFALLFVSDTDGAVVKQALPPT